MANTRSTIRRAAIALALLATLAPRPTFADGPSVESIIRQSAAEYGVSGDLLVCIDRAESGLNPWAWSPTSDAGVAQWHRWPSGRYYSLEDWGGSNPWDVRDATEAQARAIAAGYVGMWAVAWECV